jgi:hypothetical protein
MPGLKTAGAMVVAIVVGLAAGYFIWSTSKDAHPKDPRSDTAPAEFLYLDSARVLAYLGQLEGGLPPSIRRTESQLQSTDASVKAGLLAEIKGQAQHQTTVEETVSPGATDRLLTLLLKLEVGGVGQRSRRPLNWLHDLDARLSARNDGERVRRELAGLRAGDFVRISNARLFLPSYAALAPRTRYAQAYVTRPDVRRPKAVLRTFVASHEKDVRRFLKKLGSDPVLPFVLPTLTDRGSAPRGVTFLVPARYSSLIENARLLTGKLTLLGKLVYVDARLTHDVSCATKRGHGVPCTYFDQQTLDTFVPALEAAPRPVLDGLGIRRGKDVPRTVASSVRFRTPIAVVLPVAIFQ